MNIREDLGPNRDAAGHIQQILANVHCEARNPYCAATVSTVFLYATGKLPPFASASSQAIRRWFEEHNLLSHNPQDILGWKGCIAGWTNVNDSEHGHVFVVTGRLTTYNKLIAIQTLEGNCSDPAGTGIQGVFKQKRTVPIASGHELWFCNTTSLLGGSYWS